MQEEELREKNAFYFLKLGLLGSEHWNVAPPPNPDFFT
jgi:hypothetical protein